jgi:hypothetical protein
MCLFWSKGLRGIRIAGLTGLALASWLLTPVHAQDAPAEGQVRIAHDFMRLFQQQYADNALNAAAIQGERIGGVSKPAIFLHPRNREDAVVRFENIRIPEAENGLPRVFLTFLTGMRDGVVWENAATVCNGVRFSIHIDGKQVYETEMHESAWHGHAIDLQDLAGKSVTIEFHTNAIDGHTSYDWSLFGDPCIVSMNPARQAGALPANGTGLVLCRIPGGRPDSIRLVAGDAETTVPAGNTEIWKPIFFPRPEPVEALDGGRVAETLYAVYPGQLEAESLHLSTPLITASRNDRFHVILEFKNAGRGNVSGGTEYRLRITTRDRQNNPVDCTAGFGEAAARAGIMAPVPPGETGRIIWKDLKAPGMGDYQVAVQSAAPNPMDVPILSFHAFPPLPGPVATDMDAAAGIIFSGDISAPGNPAQLLVVEDQTREAFVQARLVDESGLRILGSLYPLAAATLTKPPRTDELDPWARGALIKEAVRITGGNIDGNTAEATGEIAGQKVRIRFKLDPVEPRVHMQYELEATETICLRDFTGPSVLAGDRARGIDKDFAIFPGLEYLEGEEHSSSRRDLAWPLSDRRAPAPYKICAPLIAVQSRESLIALIWDMQQEWMAGEKHPAAYFNAPPPESGMACIPMALRAPSIGEYREENTLKTIQPLEMRKGDVIRLEAWLVLDCAERYGKETIVQGPHAGGLVLQAYRHYFDLFGFPAPSPQPRDWEAEKTLCMQGYFDAVWNADPPGWAHCYGWDAGLHTGHAVPQLLMQRDTEDTGLRKKIQEHVDAVVQRAIATHGPHYLWSNAGCHIVRGELPFYYGWLDAALNGYLNNAKGILKNREDVNGEACWVWRPQAEKYVSLGQAGDHTLGQAAHPSMHILRAARLTGDPDLLEAGLDAMRQMERYDVPRGAQMWECPLYQPDILASAYAIRAYCEAYRMTGDPAHLEQARYWAWTGLPFLYLWELEGYPTMRYNVISVMGSTFHTHSWIGLPVVWCGLVYAYALQDIAPYDDSLDWNAIAQGITNSAMWQQYTEGPNAGTYPDSWNMVENRPNPADINPENILMNECRLRSGGGKEKISPHIDFRRIEDPEGTAVINSAAAILTVEGTPGTGAVTIQLAGPPGFPVFTLIAPVAEPVRVEGAGGRAVEEDALQEKAGGWCYSEPLQAIILKTAMENGSAGVRIAW